jgi:3-hydroxy-9,10-secoandrosta-1,3,5(10)-triene-9,17-dione monooxygenase reductase component
MSVTRDVAGEAHSISVTEDLFRGTLGCFATGVVVITAAVGEDLFGMAVNSFTSVSLEPPMVLFCASKASTTLPDVLRAGGFCANILSADQEDLARQFAAKGDRYSGVSHKLGLTGSPVIDGVHAYVECEISSVVDAGDHVIVLGDVIAANVDDNVGAPLVFYRSRYAGGANIAIAGF